MQLIKMFLINNFTPLGLKNRADFLLSLIFSAFMITIAYLIDDKNYDMELLCAGITWFSVLFTLCNIINRMNNLGYSIHKILTEFFIVSCYSGMTILLLLMQYYHNIHIISFFVFVFAFLSAVYVLKILFRCIFLKGKDLCYPDTDSETEIEEKIGKLLKIIKKRHKIYNVIYKNNKCGIIKTVLKFLFPKKTKPVDIVKTFNMSFMIYLSLFFILCACLVIYAYNFFESVTYNHFLELMWFSRSLCWFYIPIVLFGLILIPFANKILDISPWWGLLLLLWPVCPAFPVALIYIIMLFRAFSDYEFVPRNPKKTNGAEK
ncbi:MAG: hypothetical protein KBT47_04570 [Armatimonadetes bacterium]|nr:hypothetical protein [Candidatus Hippobium faecium]